MMIMVLVLTPTKGHRANLRTAAGTSTSTSLGISNEIVSGQVVTWETTMVTRIIWTTSMITWSTKGCDIDLSCCFLQMGGAEERRSRRPTPQENNPDHAYLRAREQEMLDAEIWKALREVRRVFGPVFI
jgi:hypothetical protein